MKLSENVLCCPQGNVTLASAQKPQSRLGCPFPQGRGRLGSLIVSPYPYPVLLHHRRLSLHCPPSTLLIVWSLERAASRWLHSRWGRAGGTSQCLELRWAAGRQVARKVLMKEVSQGGGLAELPLRWMDECAHSRKEGKKGQEEERGRRSKNTAHLCRVS